MTSATPQRPASPDLPADVVPVVRISEPRELLALVPYAVGFRPASSVVVLSLRPPRGRIGLVARLDLADLAGPDGAAVARALAEHVVRDGARRVFVAVYTDTDPGIARDVDGEVGRALRALLTTPRLPAADEPWIVGPQGFAAWTCDDVACCPAAGRPLAELDSTQVAAHMVMAGERPAERRSDLVPRPEPAGPRRRTASRALRRVRAERHALGAEDVAAWRLARIQGACALLGAATDGAGVPGPRALGELAGALEDRWVRDLVLAWLVDGEPGVDVADLDVDAAFALACLPGGRRPSRTRLRPVQAVLEAAVRLVERGARAHVLTTLAWTCWWEGDAARAGTLLAEVLQLDPEHRLAGLLATTVQGGIPPGWARGA